MILASEGLTLPEQPYQQERDALVCQSIRQLRSLQKQIALVGDVTRFRTVDKFLAYTGIAPVTLGSGGHESRLKSRFGRRELSALFHRIASTQLAVHRATGVPRNPKAKAYYEKHLGEQAGLPREKRDRKLMKKALLSLMRLQAIRFYKLMKAQKQEAQARREQEGTQLA